jgi:two-component system sensor histidine kinase RegB
LVTLAAGAAHELGTPLGTIAVVSRELQHYASALTNGAELLEDAKLIRSEVERCQLILQRMSADGAEPMGESSRAIQMGTLLDETLRHLPNGRRSGVSIDAPESKKLLTLPVRATVQSLVALLQNALDAGDGTAQVILKAHCAGEHLIFSVCDRGSGMTESVLRRIGEPFFTTKEPGEGMGLGTFLVQTFAERLGGDLSYKSASGKGTSATLTLPMQSPRKGGNIHGTT